MDVKEAFMAEKGTFVQRNYKDTIFHDLFSDKKNALSLYNALNHTDYQDTEGLEVVTLSDAIYIHLKNDPGSRPLCLL